MRLFFTAVLLMICSPLTAKTTLAMEVKVSDDGYILSYVDNSEVCESKGGPHEKECAPVKLLNEFICQEKWKPAGRTFTCESGVIEHRLTIVEDVSTDD